MFRSQQTKIDQKGLFRSKFPQEIFRLTKLLWYELSNSFSPDPCCVGFTFFPDVVISQSLLGYISILSLFQIKGWTSRSTGITIVENIIFRSSLCQLGSAENDPSYKEICETWSIHKIGCITVSWDTVRCLRFYESCPVFCVASLNLLFMVCTIRQSSSSLMYETDGTSHSSGCP